MGPSYMGLNFFKEIARKSLELLGQLLQLLLLLLLLLLFVLPKKNRSVYSKLFRKLIRRSANGEINSKS